MINFSQFSTNFLQTYGFKVFWILILFFGGRWLIKAWLRRVAKINRQWIKKSHNVNVAKRSRTIEGIAGVGFRMALYSLILIMILNLFNVEIAPLLAGFGIIGLAVGLGAQHFLQNLFAGFFIIVDEQFNIGDRVEINGERGRVVKLSLYSTALTGNKGEIIYLPNDSIKQVKNFSQEMPKPLKKVSKKSISRIFKKK